MVAGSIGFQVFECQHGYSNSLWLALPETEEPASHHTQSLTDTKDNLLTSDLPAQLPLELTRMREVQTDKSKRPT